MVSGTIRLSCARALRSTSISRFSFFDASPSRACWHISRKWFSSTSRRSLSSKSASPSISGVVVPQDPLDLVGGKDLSDDVEHSVVVQSVADLLELAQQTFQHLSLDGVGGDEVENQAVGALSVPVNTAHPLLQPVGIPRDVEVEQDVAALEVDALAGGFGGDQHLYVPILELLLHDRAGFQVRPGSRGSCRRGCCRP